MKQKTFVKKNIWKELDREAIFPKVKQNVEKSFLTLQLKQQNK
jgi:hypothetical protein